MHLQYILAYINILRTGGYCEPHMGWRDKGVREDWAGVPKSILTLIITISSILQVGNI